MYQIYIFDSNIILCHRILDQNMKLTYVKFSKLNLFQINILQNYVATEQPKKYVCWSTHVVKKRNRKNYIIRFSGSVELNLVLI